MLTEKMKTTLESISSGKEVFDRVEKAFLENKIDNQTRIESYAYWLIYNNRPGKWSSQQINFPKPDSGVSVEDVQQVFELEEK